MLSLSTLCFALWQLLSEDASERLFDAFACRAETSSVYGIYCDMSTDPPTFKGTSFSTTSDCTGDGDSWVGIADGTTCNGGWKFTCTLDTSQPDPSPSPDPIAPPLSCPSTSCSTDKNYDAAASGLADGCCCTSGGQCASYECDYSTWVCRAGTHSGNGGDGPAPSPGPSDASSGESGSGTNQVAMLQTWYHDDATCSGSGTSQGSAPAFTSPHSGCVQLAGA